MQRIFMEQNSRWLQNSLSKDRFVVKTALIHDWLVSPFGGGERYLQVVHEIYPSPIYTLLKSDEGLKGSYFANKEIISSFIQKLPRAEKKYRNYLPLFPLAIEQFDLGAYDLILSSSHCVAKGALTHCIFQDWVTTNHDTAHHLVPHVSRKCLATICCL